MEVGHMEVFNDDNNLYVKYVITEPGACLLETHLQAAADFTGIPQTKKGNPIPGQFAYSMEHSCVMAYTYPIPLDGLSGDIVIAAHAVVQMPSSGTTASCANEVFDFNQGLRKDGTAVLAARSIPENALGVPDSVRPLQSFYSLGFGGELSVTFPTFITGELTVSEVTWGSYPSETAEVSVSRDGADWTVLGVADNSASGDIRPSSFTLNECYQYVKIVDTTDSSLFGSRPDADAFDVDAVCASTTCEEETAWGGCIDVDGFGFEGKNWATYFTYTVQ